MKKVALLLLVLMLVFSFCGEALACNELSVTDRDGNPVNWIKFKMNSRDDYAGWVDTVWVNPLDYGKDELYAAAEAAYPGKTITELGGITMNGYDPEYDYIFDYFGPFTATVYNKDVRKGDKVVLFVYGEDEEQPLKKIKAYKVKNGSFSFRADAPAYCIYVILHKGRH